MKMWIPDIMEVTIYLGDEWTYLKLKEEFWMSAFIQGDKTLSSTRKAEEERLTSTGVESFITQRNFNE